MVKNNSFILPGGLYILFNCEGIGEVLYRDQTTKAYYPGDPTFEEFKEIMLTEN